MIVSTTLCPICHNYLNSYTPPQRGTKKIYVCKTAMVINTDNENYSASTHHYRYFVMEAFEDSYVEMYLSNYLLVHLIDNNTTSVFKLENGVQNFLFDVPLLDADYTKTHIVQRLKVLTTFS